MSSILPSTVQPESEIVASRFHRSCSPSLRLREIFARSIPSRARISAEADPRSKQRRSSRTRSLAAPSGPRSASFAPSRTGSGRSENLNGRSSESRFSVNSSTISGECRAAARTENVLHQTRYAVDYPVQLATRDRNARKAFQRVVQRIDQHRETSLAGIARADEYRELPKADLALLYGAEILHPDADTCIGPQSGASRPVFCDPAHFAHGAPFVSLRRQSLTSAPRSTECRSPGIH